MLVYLALLLVPQGLSAPVTTESEGSVLLQGLSQTSSSIQTPQPDVVKPWACKEELFCYVNPATCHTDCSAGLNIRPDLNSTEIELFGRGNLTADSIVSLKIDSEESSGSHLFVCVPKERRVFMTSDLDRLVPAENVSTIFVFSTIDNSSSTITCNFVANTVLFEKLSGNYAVSVGSLKGDDFELGEDRRLTGSSSTLLDQMAGLNGGNGVKNDSVEEKKIIDDDTSVTMKISGNLDKKEMQKFIKTVEETLEKIKKPKINELPTMRNGATNDFNDGTLEEKVAESREEKDNNKKKGHSKKNKKSSDEEEASKEEEEDEENEDEEGSGEDEDDDDYDGDEDFSAATSMVPLVICFVISMFL